MSRAGTRTSNARRGGRNSNNNNRARDNEGIIPVLARTVREVEGRVRRGSTRASDHATFQAIALLAREERTRVKNDKTLGEAHVAEQLKRLDGIGTILATTAALNPAFFDLLADDAVISGETAATKRQMQAAAGMAPEAEQGGDGPDPAQAVEGERRVVPQSVLSRKLASPFLAPDFSEAAPRRTGAGALASWELLGPLFRSFEEASGRCLLLHGAPRAHQPDRPGPPGADEAPGRGGRRRQGRSPHLPARRRARPGQDGTGAAGRPGRGRVPAAGRGPQRREDELGARGRPVDPAPSRDGHPRRRARRRRVRRHHRRQLRGAGPSRRVAGRLRLREHGRRRGPLHQEPHLAALPARPADRGAHPRATGPAAADGADRHPADQRHRGLPRDLAVPRLDRREEAAARR